MQKPFDGVENLEAAYDLETPEDNIKLYAAWADTYDTGYRASMDYILHRTPSQIKIRAAELAIIAAMTVINVRQITGRCK